MFSGNGFVIMSMHSVYEIRKKCTKIKIKVVSEKIIIKFLLKINVVLKIPEN